MDTGRHIWKVDVKNCAVRFNILAQTAAEAAEKGRKCAIDIGMRPAVVTSVKHEGTIDEPRRRVKRRGS